MMVSGDVTHGTSETRTYRFLIHGQYHEPRPSERGKKLDGGRRGRSRRWRRRKKMVGNRVRYNISNYGVIMK